MIAIFILKTGCGFSSSDEARGASEEPKSVDPRTGVRSEDCEAMTAKLRWQYETVRTCQRDDDCNYIEGFYAVLPHGDLGGFVTTLLCDGRSPLLIVANGSRVQLLLPQLSQVQGIQEKACEDPSGPRTGEMACGAKAGFVARSPPECRDQICVSASNDLTVQ